MKWQPGTSGNPSGRKKGDALATTTTLRRVMNAVRRQDAPDLIRRAVKQAKADPGGPIMVAILDRLVPKLKPRAEAEPMPLSADHTDAENRAALIGAMAQGQVSVDDGAALLGALKLGAPSGGVLSIVIDLGEAAPAPLVIENPT